MDGTISNPYPINYFDNFQTDILGIYTKWSKLHDKPESQTISSPLTDSKEKVVKNTLSSLGDYVSSTFESMTRSPSHKKHEETHEYSSKIFSSLIDSFTDNVIQNSSPRCKHICIDNKPPVKIISELDSERLKSSLKPQIPKRFRDLGDDNYEPILIDDSEAIKKQKTIEHPNENIALMLVDGFNQGKKFLSELYLTTNNNQSNKPQYSYPPYYMLEEL